jgi:hypothetical protein
VDIGSVFLCGVMWCGHRHEEADTQLLSTTLSRDPWPRCCFVRLTKIIQGRDRSENIASPARI